MDYESLTFVKVMPAEVAISLMQLLFSQRSAVALLLSAVALLFDRMLQENSDLR